MRRILVAAALAAAALTAWPARTAGQHGATLSEDLKGSHPRGERVRVIVQADDAGLRSVRSRHALGLRRELANALALELSREELNALAASGLVAHISGDLPVIADMAITNKVTGASTVWKGTSSLLGLLSSSGYTGKGITVAVIDSGIADHTAVSGRVIARANFVSNEPGVSGDPFGHGTHIAGIIGGSTTAPSGVTTAYAGGSAPGVYFVDVRVLGRNGSGLTSDVIAGIDWAVANRKQYKIRVINLSLGHPVAESSLTDPLCRAVARAVNAGIVVVVSAGNYGRTPEGAPVLGGITSPGNSSFALTVGSVDTAGTADRSDDTVAPYSSRGPTRYDLAVKPDVVAPGTKIVSLEAPGSYLKVTYPAWHVAGSGKNAYFRLSGTSMSTAVVSGGIALLLQMDSDLSPAQIKIAIQMGAVFVRDAGLIGAGTGSVDFVASQRLAKSGLVFSLVNTVTSVLGLSSGATFRDAGTMIDRLYDGTGVRLLGLLDLSVLFGNADSGEWGVLNLLGLSNPISSIAPNYVVWGNVAGWSSSYYVVWGNTIQSPEGQYVVWGNNNVYSDYVVWGNTVPDADK